MSTTLSTPPVRRPRFSRRLLLPLLGVVFALGMTAGWWVLTSRPDYVFRGGLAAIERDDWDGVTAAAERLDAAGQADRACYLRGLTYVKQGRYADGLTHLNRIRDEGELRLQASVQVGRCLLELGELREAHRAFSWVLQQDPDCVDAYRGLGSIAYDLGNLNDTIYHCEQWAKRDDGEGRPYRLIGLAKAYMGHNDDAVEAYRAALARKLSPAFRKAVLMELAERLVGKTQYAEALEVLDERLALAGEEDVASATLRAECLFQRGQVDEAAALIDPLVRANPDASQTLCLRGQIYLARKDVPNAIKTLEQAVARSPGEYRSRFQLAAAYSAANRPKEAEEQRKKADELLKVLDQLASLSHEAMKKPWDAEVRLRLGGLCEKIDNPKLAGMWYQAAQACQRKAQP